MYELGGRKMEEKVQIVFETIGADRANDTVKQMGRVLGDVGKDTRNLEKFTRAVIDTATETDKQLKKLKDSGKQMLGIKAEHINKAVDELRKSSNALSSLKVDKNLDDRFLRVAKTATLMSRGFQVTRADVLKAQMALSDLIKLQERFQSGSIHLKRNGSSKRAGYGALTANALLDGTDFKSIQAALQKQFDSMRLLGPKLQPQFDFSNFPNLDKTPQWKKNFGYGELSNATKQAREDAKYAFKSLTAASASHANAEIAHAKNTEAQVIRSIQNKSRAGQAAAKNAHDMMRGMTASFGQIWLSWGNLLSISSGLGVGTAITQSMLVGREFGWQMEQVGIAAEASKAQLAGMQEQILQMNASGSLQGPKQMAEGLRLLAQAGLTAEESMASLQTVMDFALIGNISDEKSAHFLAGLRSAFNLKTPEALREGADQVAMAANKSQTSIEAMSEALRQSSSEAARFGLSVADTSAMLGILAKYNIEGSAAGTSMKRFLSDLAGRTPKSTAALKELGLTIYNQHGMVKPFIQVVEEVQQKLSGMTDKAKQSWLKTIFDERAIKSANILLSEAGKEFAKLHRQTSRAGENMGYTAVNAERLEDTSEGSWRKMKNAWEGAFASVGTQTQAGFKDLMSQLTKLANDSQVRGAIMGIVEAFQALAKFAATAASALVPLSGVLAGGVAGLSLWAGKEYIQNLTAGIQPMQLWAEAKQRYVEATKSSAVAQGQEAIATAASTGVTKANAAANVSNAAAKGSDTVATHKKTQATVTNTAAENINTGAVRANTLAYRAKEMAAVAATRATTALSGALTVGRGILAAVGGVWGIAISAATLWIGYMAQGAKATTTFADEVAKLDKSLMAVSVDKLEAFNNVGFGKKLDANLGIGYVAADASKALLSPQTLKDYETNVQRIENMTANMLEEVKRKYEGSNQDIIEQSTMLLDRKKSILQAELEKFDATTSHMVKLDEEAAGVRETLERSLYNVSVQLMNQRTNLAIQNMRNMAAEAAKTMNWFDKLLASLNLSETGQKATAFFRGIERKIKAGVPLTKDESDALAEYKTSPDANPYVIAKKYSPTVDYQGAKKVAGASDRDVDTAIKNDASGVVIRTKEAIAAAMDRQQKLAVQAIETRKLIENGGAHAGLHAQELQGIEKQMVEVRDVISKLNTTHNKAAEKVNADAKAQNGNRQSPDSVKGSLSTVSAPDKKKKVKGAGGTKSKEEYYGLPTERAEAKLSEEMVKTKERLYRDAANFYGYQSQQAQEAFKNLQQARKSAAGESMDAKIAERQKEIAKAQDVIKNPNKYTAESLAKAKEALTRLNAVSQVYQNSHPQKSNGRLVDVSKLNESNIKKGNWTNATVTNRVMQYLPLIAKYAKEYGQNPELMAAIMMQESKGHKNAVSHVGARGVMQFMPKTAKWIGVKDPTNPEDAIRGAAKFLKWIEGRYGKNDNYKLQYYNSGRVNKNGVSKFRETRDYVSDINNARYAINDDVFNEMLKASGGSPMQMVAQTNEVLGEQAQLLGQVNDALTAGNQAVEAGRMLEEARRAEIEHRLAVLQQETQTKQIGLDADQHKLEMMKLVGTTSQKELLTQQHLVEQKKLQLEYEEKIAEAKIKYGDGSYEVNRLTNEYQTKQGQLTEKQGIEKQNLHDSQSYLGGFKSAVKRITSEADNDAKMVGAVVDSTYGHIATSLGHIMDGNKVKWSDFRDALLNDLKKIALRMAVLKLIDTAVSVWGGASAAGATGATNMSVNPNAAVAPKFNFRASAKGDVFNESGRLRAYAKGGVVHSPTYFNHAGGLGLMGENGAEAVMPLTRLANGDLGVKAAGMSGAAGGVVINAPVQVTVTVDGEGNADSKIQAEQAKSLGNSVRLIVIDEVQKMLRNGGMINNAMKGRTA